MLEKSLFKNGVYLIFVLLAFSYFSQGTSMQTIAWTYHVGHSTVHYIVKETASAIWEALSKTYLKPPSSEEEWLQISREFEKTWNFPHCLGALDGKHIHIQAPSKSGSLFFNYKKTFSIILMASCDAKYNFTLVDIGAYGSESDGGVFAKSLFGKMLDANQMAVPKPKPLANSLVIHPFTFVADEAFPLKSYILRPYPGKNLDRNKRIFNYRLSRARRMIENSFGILVSRWRLLKNHINANVDNIDSFVKAIICLHNFANKESESGTEKLYCPSGFVDGDDNLGSWRDEVTPLQSVGRVGANRSSRLLADMRDKLKDYFISPAGFVPWQENIFNIDI